MPRHPDHLLHRYGLCMHKHPRFSNTTMCFQLWQPRISSNRRLDIGKVENLPLSEIAQRKQHDSAASTEITPLVAIWKSFVFAQYSYIDRLGFHFQKFNDSSKPQICHLDDRSRIRLRCHFKPWPFVKQMHEDDKLLVSSIQKVYSSVFYSQYRRIKEN